MTDNETPTRVQAVCPHCWWVSAWVVLEQEPNALWFARQKATIEYRQHYERSHQPIPKPTWNEMSLPLPCTEVES